MLTVMIGYSMGDRANIADCRMATLRIIEGFNAKEKVGGPGHGPHIAH
jgi:hypothetical protein